MTPHADMMEAADLVDFVATNHAPANAAELYCLAHRLRAHARALRMQAARPAPPGRVPTPPPGHAQHVSP